MRKTWLHRGIAVMLAAVMLMAGTGCSGTGKTENEEKEPAQENHEDGAQGGLTGTITVGYTSEQEEMYQKLIAKFNEMYPDVEVIPQSIPGTMYGQITKMTALAAADNLPDICIGSEQFGYIMQQGWAYPIENLLNEDEDCEYVLQSGLERFSYNGHIFALPYRVHFNTIAVNEDLLNTLNMDKPDYDWTLDEFISMAKKATTNEYSGINYVYNGTNPTWGLDNKLMGALLPDGYEQFGYSFDTHNIDLTVNNAWVESNNILNELSSVPGLISDNLKASSSGSMNDYEKKFGKDADALVSGKVLFGNHSTWEYATFAKSNFKFDFYPVPTAEGIPQRIQMHVDFCYMTTKVTEENRQAAWEFLKFISFRKEGCLIRLEDMQNVSGTKNLEVYVPASADPEVLAAFDESVYVDGIKYMYHQVVEHPEQTLVADCDKVVPNFWSDITQYRDTAVTSVQEGTDPSALVTDLQTKASEAIANSWQYFCTSMDKNLETFYASHPWEKSN